MNDVSKLSDTIKPKSDQLNSDDLLADPITVTITAVERGNAEQPIRIKINNGFQPYYPCKSMRRVMIAAWGDDGRKWAGNSLTLYADPSVKFGGVLVGGIRISHMTGIESERAFMLTATRGSKKEHRVKPLNVAQAEQVQQYPDAEFASNLPKMRAAIASGKSTPEKIFAHCEKTGRLTAVQKLAITAPDEPVQADDDQGVF